MQHRVSDASRPATKLLPGNGPQQRAGEIATAGLKVLLSVNRTYSNLFEWETIKSTLSVLLQRLPDDIDLAMTAHGGWKADDTFTDWNFASPKLTIPELQKLELNRNPGAGLNDVLLKSLGIKNLKVIITVEDDYGNDIRKGRELAELLARQGTRLIVLHQKTRLGFSRYPDRAALQELAEITGGGWFPLTPTSVVDLADLFAAILVVIASGVGGFRKYQRESGVTPVPPGKIEPPKSPLRLAGGLLGLISKRG